MIDPKLTIRPEIPGLEPAATAAERFQNETLRPILKMQNDLLGAIFSNYLRRRKVPFQQFSAERRAEWIENTLQKDQRLRQLMLGAVIGHFTLEEWETYRGDEPELARRVIGMLIRRLQSQSSGLASSNLSR